MTGGLPDDAVPAVAPVVGEVTPEPTPDELAAIVAAIDAAWPRPTPSDQQTTSPVWRFSGRWWRAPVATRRERPESSWNPYRSTES